MWKKVFNFCTSLFNTKTNIKNNIDFSKLCKDCKYCHIPCEDLPQIGFCTYLHCEKEQRSIVNGQLKDMLQFARSCESSRQYEDDNYCGPEGKFWEKKEE